MENITLHADHAQQRQIRTRKLTFRFNFILWIYKLLGYKFNEVANTSEYKYNPEQYCIDRGILQQPSSFRKRGRSRMRLKV